MQVFPSIVAERKMCFPMGSPRIWSEIGRPNRKRITSCESSILACSLHWIFSLGLLRATGLSGGASEMAASWEKLAAPWLEASDTYPVVMSSPTR